MTQIADVLALLRSRGVLGVTPLEALEHVGTMRLAARINDLRAAGYDIETQTWTTTATRKRVVRYVLHEQEQLTLDSQQDRPEGRRPSPGASGRAVLLAAEWSATAGSRPR